MFINKVIYLFKNFQKLCLNFYFFSDGNYYPVRHYVDEENTGWKNTDAEILSNHKHIINSLLGNDETIGNYKWKASEPDHYFRKINQKI